MQQSSATPSLHLVFRGCGRLLHTHTPTSQGLSCITSFWHGVIPISFFILMIFIHCHSSHDICTEVLNPSARRYIIRTRIRADYTHAYNYTHGLRTCNGKVYGKLDVRQNGGLNHSKL